MFGYVMPGTQALDEQEKERYSAMYCGLCRSIGQCCGQRCRLTLSYDMTFLSILLGSLYEPDEHEGMQRCPQHPVKPHPYVRTEVMDYAADLSVALAYHKCADDWRDDKKLASRAATHALQASYDQARARNERAFAEIEAAMDDITAIEQAAASGDAESAPGPDAAANRFGMMLGELFAYRDDFWSDDVRRFGMHLGKFVYAMDAAVDFDDDAASGSYNPFVLSGATRQDMRTDLQVLAGAMADSFERLPLERDLHLLRSVLYEGVWLHLNRQDEKLAKKQERHSRHGPPHDDETDPNPGAQQTYATDDASKGNE